MRLDYECLDVEIFLCFAQEVDLLAYRLRNG